MLQALRLGPIHLSISLLLLRELARLLLFVFFASRQTNAVASTARPFFLEDMRAQVLLDSPSLSGLVAEDAVEVGVLVLATIESLILSSQAF